MDASPQKPDRTPPFDLVSPTPEASPGDLLPSFGDDVPFWKPSWQDVFKQLGWRWLMLVPAVVLLAGLAMLPWRPQFLQLLFWGGGKLLLLSVGGAIGMAGTAIRAVVRQRKEPFCIHCGYTLLGLPDHHICPECGRPYSLRLIDEYRRDPHWFVQRYKAHRILPNADEPFLARPSTKPKSRDGT